MILILLSLYHAYYSSGFAAAYPVHSPGATAIVYPREEVIYDTNYRSTFNIVQSCLATIFACTWVAMHPDVPKDRSTWWGKNKKHIYLFLAALLGPEMVIPGAIKDWSSARYIKSSIPSYTSAQCHFLAMGGVVFRTDTDFLTEFDLRYPTHLEALKRHPIDVDEISARSKSSWLGKSLVVVQVLWFVLQCIARGAQRLAITELEIMTLGYAALNGVLYAIWWYKPAGVEAPLIIDLSRNFEDKLSAQDDTIATNAAPPGSSGEEGPKANGVTNFLLEHSGENNSYFVLGIVGAIFGGLHCIAFSFHFPSPIASTLWKVSALFIAISPLFLVSLFILATKIMGSFFTNIFISPIVMLVGVGYIGSRIILIVVSFWALTSIPQSGHQTAVWTKFIAHV